MENQIKKKVENESETRVMWGIIGFGVQEYRFGGPQELGLSYIGVYIGVHLCMEACHINIAHKWWFPFSCSLSSPI